VEVTGSAPAPLAPGGQPSGGQPAAPGQPQPATGQPPGGQPVTGQSPGGQPAHGGHVPPALPPAPARPPAPQPGQQPYGQAYYGAPTPASGPAQGQRGFPPPPPPESGSRRPWPAPDGAPAPPSYPLPPAPDNQWLWDDGASGNSGPGNGSVQSGTHPTVILQSSQPQGPGAPAGPPPTTVQPTTVQPGTVPPTTIAPTTVQPGALPPGALPPGAAPYGPPATTVQPSQHQQGFAAGGPQPWPQGPNGPAGQYGPPGPGGPLGPHDSTSTMPSMAPFGPGGQDQWGPAMGGWPQAGPGPGRTSGLSGIGNRLSGLRAKRPHGPVIPAIGVAAAIVVIAAIVVAVRGGGGSNQAANNTPAPGATASAPKQQSDAAQQQAATQLAGLLSQSGGDRGDVNRAYFAVQACRTLPRDRQVFARAAANRRNLLNKLGSLPDASALNPAMIQALTGAWQASAQADTDYANWAASLEHGCKKGKTGNNPNLKASFVPDGTATADKKAFVQEWNPLAQKYGLKTYTFGEL
jgi:hypothetical protein